MRTISLILGCMLLIGAWGACSADMTVIATCDPKAPFPSEGCIAQFAADAGTDADSSDGSGGGSSARNACPGRCVPDPYGASAGSWSKEIVSLWVGPGDKLPDCPAEAGVPTEKFRRFDKLIAPPAECDACECGASEGMCTGLPESIEIRSGTCAQSGVSSLPFDGPPGWDGSCSNEGALLAGQLCNGVPCAQSVWSPLLTGPTTEKCAPKSVTPTTKVESAKWELGALACYGNTRDDECNDASKFCLNDPGLPWLYCVYYDGKYSEESNAPACPDNFNYARYTMYPEKTVDNRGCEECSCGDPTGSGCYGSVPIYSDGACQNEITKLLVSTVVEGCQNISPPGIALGSKNVTALGYMPGTCAASGGTPKGSATADLEQPTTFCCASFWDIE